MILPGRDGKQTRPARSGHPGCLRAVFAGVLRGVVKVSGFFSFRPVRQKALLFQGSVAVESSPR